ncbi:hypothetical protein ACHAPF_011502 [Botrytis cinerea]
MEKPKSRLELLPVESIQAIQCLIKNVPDLSSIILTCKAMHNAFVSADQPILKQVFTNEIGSEVLPEAFLTALISRQTTVSDDVLDSCHNRFIENARNIKRKDHLDLRICDALFMSNLHSHVVYFTNDFISKAFTSQIFTEDISIITRQLPVSDKEKWRIQRTFYHFQIYCYIFHEKKTLFPVHLQSDQNKIFFNYFSIWENEQLACVHDYMFRVIAPGFDELVDHDVEWGEYMMNYASFDDPENMEPLIARGLFAVRNMVEAKGYKEIRKSYYQDYPEYSSNLLDHGLRNSAHGSGDEWHWLEGYSKEEEDKFIKNPVWYDDEDKGPELVWRWAHQSCGSVDFVLCDKHRFEREWGYVMWDYSRILELGVTESEWERTDDAENNKGSRPSRESMDRREKIYRTGGRGWWSAEDESKVVWPDGCAPWDKPVKPERWDPKDGKSIDEAKDFIKRLKLP